jgi:PhnB protein
MNLTSIRRYRAEEISASIAQYSIRQFQRLNEVYIMSSPAQETIISLMLAVPDTPAAVDWYRQALGARLLWSLGSVAGLVVNGAPFFLHEPVAKRFNSPSEVGTTTVRVELFVDDPDVVIARAVAAGATGGDINDYLVPWGIHRQGGFTDPYGHIWLVGDKSPLRPFPA